MEQVKKSTKFRCKKCGGRLCVQNIIEKDGAIVRYRVCRQCGKRVKSVEVITEM